MIVSSTVLDGNLNSVKIVCTPAKESIESWTKKSSLSRKRCETFNRGLDRHSATKVQWQPRELMQHSLLHASTHVQPHKRSQS